MGVFVLLLLWFVKIGVFSLFEVGSAQLCVMTVKNISFSENV